MLHPSPEPALLSPRSNFKAKAAIAAAISLRSYLLVTPDDSAAAPITLTFPDIELAHSWPLDSLPWAAFSKVSAPVEHPVMLLDEALVAELQPQLQLISPELPESKRKIHKAAALAFLYILMTICRGSPPASHTFTMRSTIPIAAGLGSSASISVCIAAAVLTLTGHLPAPSAAGTADADVRLELINTWAFVGELCIHGNPSGVDNTVATRGRAVLFKRKQRGQPPTVTPLNDFPVLPLLLVNTKQSRSTATEVAKVQTLLDAFPSVINPILDAVDRITETAHELIAGLGTGESHGANVIESLGSLVRLNHGLLVTLGVSHPRLERIRTLVEEAGVGYTKLTGAGGGGCAITLLAEGSKAALPGLEERLEEEGFAKYETLLGGPGVGILEAGPGSAGGIKVPTQKDFLTAGGTAGVEGLVGASDESKGWKYW